MKTLKTYFVLLIFVVTIQFVVKLSEAIESPAEIYWKAKVGNNLMPKSLRESLQLGSYDEIGELLNIKEGENVENELWFYSGGYFSSEKDAHLLSADPIIKPGLPEDHRPTYFTTDKLFGDGTKLKIYFKSIDNKAKFLPLSIAKSIPTKSDKLQVILNILSIKPKSFLAERVDKILKNCEHSGVKDEVRHCATSLEAMVDIVTSNLNYGKNNFMVVATERNNGVPMEYTFQKVQKIGSDDKENMVCHKINDPFVVYICHNIKKTNIYRISLVGADGKQTEAIATCHMDTSSWNPNHRAFHVLNTKPGMKPVCHFIGADSIAWLPNVN